MCAFEKSLHSNNETLDVFFEFTYVSCVEYLENIKRGVEKSFEIFFVFLFPFLFLVFIILTVRVSWDFVVSQSKIPKPRDSS